MARRYRHRTSLGSRAMPGVTLAASIHRQIDVARLCRAMPDPLRGLLVIAWLGQVDVRHVSLRVAVIQRKRLDCTCTITRWPFWNVWLALGRSKRYGSTWLAASGFGSLKLSR